MSKVLSSKAPSEIELTRRRNSELSPTNHVLENGHSPHVPSIPWEIEVRYLAALFWIMIVCGWNDASSGPLLPRMQEFYHLTYTIVSLIFVSICIGFFAAAASNVYLEDRLGVGKVLCIGTLAQMSSYIIMSTPVPFPVFCIGFAIAGFGSGLVISLSAAFVTKLPARQNLKMCLFQACYGLGALCAPLAATQFSNLPKHWRFHYLISLGLACTSLGLIVWVFRFQPEEKLLPEEIVHVTNPVIEVGTVEGERSERSSASALVTDQDSWKKMKDILRSRVIHAMALWAFLYVGLEVTIGGWITTYIQQVRGGDHTAGYISTGFWAGLTVGRLCFIWVNEKLGERKVMFGYALVALGLEMIVWFVPNLIGNAVSVALVGLCLGPMFPIMLSVASQSIPRALAGGALCWIESLGQVGSAILPFATGALSTAYGVKVLQPLVVSMIGGTAVAWGAVLFFAGRVKKD